MTYRRIMADNLTTTAEFDRQVALMMSEEQLIRNVIDLAKRLGWKCVHFRPAWSGKGCRTPIQGDKGSPDLLLARNGYVIFAELKSERGVMSDEQIEWAVEITPRELSTTHKCCLWRPSHWIDDTIKTVLERGW